MAMLLSSDFARSLLGFSHSSVTEYSNYRGCAHYAFNRQCYSYLSTVNIYICFIAVFLLV